MKSKLFWIVTAELPKDDTDEQWERFVEADSIDGVNGSMVRPTKKSAKRLAEKLAKKMDYPMAIYWKKGRKSWKYNMVYEND